MWIKQVGCGCPCGPDPCTDGCVCTFATGEVFGSVPTSDLYDVTGQFTSAHPVSFNFDVTGRWGVEVYANSVLVFSWACPGGGATSFTIPAGTTSIEIVVPSPCHTSDEGWRYDLSC